MQQETPEPNYEELDDCKRMYDSMYNGAGGFIISSVTSVMFYLIYAFIPTGLHMRDFMLLLCAGAGIFAFLALVMVVDSWHKHAINHALAEKAWRRNVTGYLTSMDATLTEADQALREVEDLG